MSLSIGNYVLTISDILRSFNAGMNQSLPSKKNQPVLDRTIAPKADIVVSTDTKALLS
jgi:hypothetical protein